MRAAARKLFLLAASLALSSVVCAQDPGERDTPKKQDACRADHGPSGAPSAAGDACPPAEAPPPDPFSIKALPRQILKDQKFLWLRPFHPQRGDLSRAGILLTGTAVVAALDRPVAGEIGEDRPGPAFRISRRVGAWTGGLTDFGVAGAFYAVGRWRGNERAQNTGVLGFRAMANTVIMVHALKLATQRSRPSLKNGMLKDNADAEFFEGGDSFPSGHAAQAWALATVVAQQYRHRRWVPIAAYGLAGFVASSRVSGRRHYLTDVALGSLLGHMVGRYVVRQAAVEQEKLRRWQLIPHPVKEGGAATLLLQF